MATPIARDDHILTEGHFEYEAVTGASNNRLVIKHDGMVLDGDFGMQWSVQDINDPQCHAELTIKRFGYFHEISLLKSAYSAPTASEGSTSSTIVNFLDVVRKVDEEDCNWYKKSFEAYNKSFLKPIKQRIRHSNDYTLIQMHRDATKNGPMRTYIIPSSSKATAPIARVHYFDVALSVTVGGRAAEPSNVVVLQDHKATSNSATASNINTNSNIDSHSRITSNCLDSLRCLLDVTANGKEHHFDVSGLAKLFKGRLLLGAKNKEVYRGAMRDGTTVQSVVLKIVKSDNPSCMLSFKREILALRLLRDPSLELSQEYTLSREHAAFRTPTCSVLVLPYLAHGSVVSLFVENSWYQALENPEREEVAKCCVHDVLEGLAFLRTCGVFHLDISPENIVLREDKWILIDFGESRLQKDCPVHDADICRKPCFWDPIHVRAMIESNQREVPRENCFFLGIDDLARLDRWCLGVTLVIMLTAFAPSQICRKENWTNPPSLALPSAISEDFEKWVCRWTASVAATLQDMKRLYHLSDEVVDLLQLLLLDAAETRATDFDITERATAHSWFLNRNISNNMKLFKTTGVSRTLDSSSPSPCPAPNVKRHKSNAEDGKPAQCGSSNGVNIAVEKSSASLKEVPQLSTPPFCL